MVTFDKAYLKEAIPNTFVDAFASELIGHLGNSTVDPYIYNGYQLYCTLEEKSSRINEERKAKARGVEILSMAWNMPTWRTEHYKREGEKSR